LVQRHEEAVAKGRWTQPFPIDDAKRFFSVVEENTPRFFEPEVNEGIRQVEQAVPLVELGPDEKRVPSATSEPTPYCLPRPLPNAPANVRLRQLPTRWRYF
jgi:hypothetical protein